MGSVGSPARNPWRCSPSHGCGLRVLLIFSRYLCYGSLFGSLFPMPLSFPALPFANARLRFDSLDAHAASLSLWRLQSTVLCFHSNQEGTGERGASGRVKGSCGCGMSWSETRGLCLGEHAGSPGLEGCGFGVATLVWGSARFLVGGYGVYFSPQIQNSGFVGFGDYGRLPHSSRLPGHLGFRVLDHVP